MYRNQFHLGDQISLGLYRRHKRSRPGRCIFDERAGERNPRTVRISHCMGGTGIRHTGYDIRLYMITLRELRATLITHFFNTDSFVRGRRISIIYPQKGTDFHVFSRLYQRPHAFRCHHGDLSRSQFTYRLVSQIQISKTFKGNTICPFLFAHGHRSTSHLISGRIDSLGCHDQ